jgi:hypothetical protein
MPATGAALALRVVLVFGVMDMEIPGRIRVAPRWRVFTMPPATGSC